METYTKSQLIEASKKYHKEALKNPDKYSENDLSEKTAVEFIDHLLNFVENE